MKDRRDNTADSCCTQLPHPMPHGAVSWERGVCQCARPPSLFLVITKSSIESLKLGDLFLSRLAVWVPDKRSRAGAGGGGSSICVPNLDCSGKNPCFDGAMAQFSSQAQNQRVEEKKEEKKKKLAVVLGATRGQGASVVNALLQSNEYVIRGVARDAHTPAAEALTRRGVEVVEADLDDAASLRTAFASAHAIFAVTTMYDGAMEREVRQGMNIADAAAAAAVPLEHFVWSTLPSASTVSRGKVSVPHMDGKARVDEYIISSLPGLAAKTTFYWGGFYAENVTYPNFRPGFLDSAAKHVWVQPVAATTVVPMVGDHHVNTGVFVRRILERRDVCLPGRYVLGVVDWLGNGDLLNMWVEILARRDGHGDSGMEPVYVHSDVETVGKLWPGMGSELGGMLKLLEELGKGAWAKEGGHVLTMGDLDLKVGEGEGDLVSMESALKKLASEL